MNQNNHQFDPKNFYLAATSKQTNINPVNSLHQLTSRRHIFLPKKFQADLEPNEESFR